MFASLRCPANTFNTYLKSMENNTSKSSEKGNSNNRLLPADFSLDAIIPYMENTTEESWCTDVVKTKNGNNCLFGHLFDLGGGQLFEWFEENIATTFMVYPVNDGKNENYQQPTPKQRCVAYLKDLKSGKAKTVCELVEEYHEFLAKENTEHHE